MNLRDHLDLIAAAPDGIRKLRGLILELAVRGKLVPQNPNDEPASELLKRIARERARLEGGTARKNNEQASLGDDGSPFELPASYPRIPQNLTEGYLRNAHQHHSVLE